MISLKQTRKLELGKKIGESKGFYGFVMSFEDTKIYKFHDYPKSDKTPSIIHEDFESLIKRLGGCKNNYENSSAAKLDEHIPCGYSISMISTFDGIKTLDVYRGEDCMKKFCTPFRHHAMKKSKFKKKKTIPLINEQ